MEEDTTHVIKPSPEGLPLHLKLIQRGIDGRPVRAELPLQCLNRHHFVGLLELLQIGAELEGRMEDRLRGNLAVLEASLVADYSLFYAHTHVIIRVVRLAYSPPFRVGLCEPADKVQVDIEKMFDLSLYGHQW